MWNTPNPESLDDIIDSNEREHVAHKYYDAAINELELLKVGNDDPEILIRAVHYLSIHAIPPMHDSIHWFREGLHLLLELACPSVAGRYPIFEDIKRGMALSEEFEKQRAEQCVPPYGAQDL
jgi:hypothetical protein